GHTVQQLPFQMSVFHLFFMICCIMQYHPEPFVAALNFLILILIFAEDIHLILRFVFLIAFHNHI
ncbi:MAG: hypothetical protein ACK55Z_20535, partial [bacterium]